MAKTRQPFLLVLIACLVISVASFPIKVSAQVVVQDSLALVDIYNSTNGPNWNTGNYNWLTGPVSTWSGVIVSGDRVTGLDFINYRLRTEIPISIFDLDALTYLNLTANDLTGSIPVELTQLSNLTYLNLSDNHLTGPIPSQIRDLSGLEILDLIHNELSGSIPTELGDLSTLAQLVLAGNKLTGSIPSQLGQLSNLWLLNLTYNLLTGSIPREIGDMSSLVELRLDSNQLSGVLPVELGNVLSLVFVRLDQNRLTGSIPPQIGNLTNLTDLRMEDNQLSGNIPATIGSLSNLDDLRLSRNKLSGAIPRELGQLSKLVHLSLHNNRLSGEIPSELGALSNLRGLLLYENLLSGAIPPELASLSKLNTLALNDNDLSGGIPPPIGDLPFLNFLRVNNNPSMAGTLPTNLTSLEHLLDFFFDGTNLCEPFDASFQEWLSTVSRVHSNGCVVGDNAIYVNHAAMGANIGTSWINAFIHLQDALQAAQSGDEIWVAAGTYRPDQGAHVTLGDREASFVIPSGTSLYGGFSGTEISRDQRDWEVYETVLSGDLLENDDDILTLENPLRLDNSHNIVTIQDMRVDARLDGFTVADGLAEARLNTIGESVIRIRRHLLDENARAIIANCVITRNTATNAVIYIGRLSSGSDPIVIIKDSKFIRNSRIGILIYGGTILIKNILMTGNGAQAYFQAIRSIDATIYLHGSTIFDNRLSTAIYFGGGNGGTLYMWENKILGNFGGDTHIDVHSGNLVSINDIFSGNEILDTNQGGGAIRLLESDARIVNDVFAFNSVQGSGGAIRSEVSNLSISNSIFYQNESPQALDISSENPDYGRIEISHSLLQQPPPSYVIDRGGVIIGNPFFVDADGADNIHGTLDDDFRLTNMSSAIDAGINDSLFADFWDLDDDGDSEEWWPTDFLGNMRVFDGGSGTATVDMGAFEYDAPPVIIANEYVQALPVNSPRLQGNYPNPFNPSTTISYTLPHPSDVRLEVFDLLGKRVRMVESGFKPSGDHEVAFDATWLSTGIYFYTLTTGDFNQSRKMMVIK